MYSDKENKCKEDYNRNNYSDKKVL